MGGKWMSHDNEFFDVDNNLRYENKNEFIKYIAGYKIIKKIGEGSMGIVFLVLDEKMNKKYAAKVVTDPKLQVYLLEEAEKLKFLNDRSFPYIVDYVEETGYSAMIYEYIDGINFASYLEKNAPLGKELSCKFILQISKILDYLHNQRPSLIYCDLKPENIILQTDGNLRLVDFGACLSLEKYTTHKHNYKENMGIGTYGYSAPELIVGGMLSKGTDIYSLGMLFYYMITGNNPAKPPFGIYENDDNTLTVSKNIMEVIKSCCHKNLEQRICDINEFETKIIEISKMKDSKYTLLKDKLIRKIILALYTLLLFGGAAYSGYLTWYSMSMPYVKSGMIILFVCIWSLATILKIIIDRCLYKNNFIKKKQWNVFYTEKKMAGLCAILICVFFLTGCIQSKNFGSEENLFVTVQDSDGRCILLKDGVKYYTEDNLTFTLSPEEGCEYQVFFYKSNVNDNVARERYFEICR